MVAFRPPSADFTCLRCFYKNSPEDYTKDRTGISDVRERISGEQLIEEDLQMVRDYQCLEYNDVFDWRNRINSIFAAEE